VLAEGAFVHVTGPDNFLALSPQGGANPFGFGDQPRLAPLAL
jgi:hypothetical protein